METKENTPLTDITSDSQEQPLKENLAMLAALESKSRLIDNMAHQIRTLSNAIIGFSELLDAENLDDSQREYLSEIHQAGRGLSNLVNDILDIVQLDSGKLRPSKSRCDLAEILIELYQILNTAAKQKGLDFSLVADANTPARIFTDGNRLVKCLINLTTNAIKYTKQGFVRLSISLVEKNDNPWFKFDVEDSGEGMSPDRLSRIFDEIALLKGANRGALSDLDLGLLITGTLPVTKRLITALGGTISVSSVPGHGTTFSMCLPAELDIQTEKKLDLSHGPWAENYISPITTEETGQTFSPENKTTAGHILLVEDMESNRVVITLLLETLGLRVTSAKDGQEAVDKGLAEPFDLILMDLMLPKISGYQATRVLREHHIKTPIIALTAGVIDDDNAHDITSQFDAMLSKPVDGKKLSQVMQIYLPKFNTAGPCNIRSAENSDAELIIEYSK